MLTITDYKNALNQKYRRHIYKVEWMDKDENVIGEYVSHLISGDLNIQKINGSRRDGRITFENVDLDFTSSEKKIISLSNKFKLYTGLAINNEEYFIPQGVFNIGNPSITSNPSIKSIQIEGYDNFNLLNGTINGELESDYVIPAGSVLTDAIKTLIAETDIPTTPIIVPSTEIAPYDIAKESGNTYADVILEVAGILSYVTYCNSDGRFVFKPDPEIGGFGTLFNETLELPNITPVWYFRDNDTEILFNGQVINPEYTKVKNYIVVYGENVNGGLVKGIAQDSVLFSPTSVSKIGKRIKVIKDNNIYSDDLANQRALYELNKAIQINTNSDIKCVPIDFLREGDVVGMIDNSSGIDYANYIINQISLSFSENQEQTLKGWRMNNNAR